MSVVMKQNFSGVRSEPLVTFLLISVTFVLCLHGCLSSKDGTKNLDKDLQKDEKTPGINSQSQKLDNINLPSSKAKAETPRIGIECAEKDKECEKDKLGFDAIRMLHLLIDDDHNGNVDQSESDEFIRDELQYTDGFERHSLFHNNDKLISVDDLWKAWKYSAVYNWTVDDVIEWLVQDVNLPQYSQVFHNLAIDGSALPRLVNSTGPLLASLGIRNPVHKQKLSLKAMDTVLFGAPKKVHSYMKDIMLFLAIVLAVGISWFACLHHRYSQTQVKKMMKDLESLQKAEDALKKLSRELADAEKNQVSMTQDKQEELRMLRRNSMRLKVSRVNNGESPILSREGSTYRRQEGERKLKQAEEELVSLREALTEAESRLEIQQQLESQWSVPGELQAWLQLTHELEQIHYNAKRQAAERQLLAAKDGCDKIKRRNKAFFGSLRMAHSNSMDDIDQSILDARASLEEVKQDLQERLHRWHTIELLCGFPVISNPGLNALKQALGRETSNTTRIPTSLLGPMSIDEADEDVPPTAFLSTLQNNLNARPRASSAGYSTGTLPASGKTSTFHKNMTGSTGSLTHLGKLSSSSSVSGGHVRSVSREEFQGPTTGNTSPPGGAVGSSSNSVVFQLGENSQYERTVSNSSQSPISTSSSNGPQHGHVLNLHNQAKSGYNQPVTYPAYNYNTSTPVLPAVLDKTGSSGNLLASNTIPRGSGGSSMKMYNSTSGNYLVSSGLQLNKSASPSPAALNSSFDSTDAKFAFTDSGDMVSINNGNISLNTAGVTNSGLSQSAMNIPHSTSMQSAKIPYHEDSDGVSLDSLPRSQSQSVLSRGRLARSPELEYSSLESLQSSRVGVPEETPGKKLKKKKFLHFSLLKGKGKQKTT